jgi:hypothetical protein
MIVRKKAVCFDHGCMTIKWGPTPINEASILRALNGDRPEITLRDHAQNHKNASRRDCQRFLDPKRENDQTFAIAGRPAAAGTPTTEIGAPGQAPTPANARFSEEADFLTFSRNIRKNGSRIVEAQCVENPGRKTQRHPARIV